jgi:hypothetical protein
LAKNRRKVGASGSSSAKLNELADELAQVAKQPVPLNGGSLARREVILHCEAVQALAPGADSGTLISNAEDAIKAAIESIPVYTERRIARAMFAVDEEYRDTAIYKRQELLDKNENISSTVWDARRRKVLDAIAAALLAPIAETVRPQTSSPQPSIIPLRGVALQAQRAAILHYAALATLFVSEFDQELSSGTFRTPSQAYFFNAYIALMYGPWFELAAQAKGKLALRQSYADELDGDTLDRIAHLGQVLDSDSPIGPTTHINIKPIQTLHFQTHFEAELALGSHHLLTFNELLPDVDSHEWLESRQMDAHLDDAETEAARVKLMDIYHLWCRWLRASLATDADRASIERLVGASGALSILLSKHSTVKEAIQTTGRALAHKAIATYYDTPDWQPLPNGRSLRQQADAFFDRTGPTLVMSFAS